MTTLPTLPSTVNTVEKVLMWSASALHALFRTKKVQIVENSLATPVMDMTFYNSADGKRRVTIIANLELSDDWDVDATGKTWNYVNPLGDIAVPTGYQSN